MNTPYSLLLDATQLPDGLRVELIEAGFRPLLAQSGRSKELELNS